MAPPGRADRSFGDLVQGFAPRGPDDIPALVVARAKDLGAVDAARYLVDYEQRILAPVPHHNGPEHQEVGIDATLAG